MKPGKLSQIIKHPERPVLLRGEVWVSPEVLSSAGFDQGPKGLVDFASSSGADIAFFHWPESPMAADLRELVDLAHGARLDCALTIDGPFQQLSHTRNTINVLQELGRDPSGFQSLLAQGMEEIAEALNLVRDSGIDLIVLTEDVAYTGGLYFSPQLFRKALLPSYAYLVSRFLSPDMAFGWHSDGDVDPLLPDLVRCGFRFFSLEPECIDLLKLKKTFGSKVSLISGIRAAWLAGRDFDQEHRLQCLREISALAKEGGLILASSCGLYDPESLLNLRQIYRVTENITSSSEDHQTHEG